MAYIQTCSTNGVRCVKSRYETVSADSIVPTPTAAKTTPANSTGTASRFAVQGTPYQAIMSRSTPVEMMRSSRPDPAEDSGMMRRGKYTLLTRWEDPTSDCADAPTALEKKIHGSKPA